MRRSAVSTYWRPAADSSAQASASRPASDSSARSVGSPGGTTGRGCAAARPRRSSIRVQYNRPRVRISSTCAGGIHDSGNRPSTSSVRSSRASARSVLARFFGPRNAAISAGSPRCTPTPAAASSSPRTATRCSPPARTPRPHPGSARPATPATSSASPAGSDPTAPTRRHPHNRT